ncbi:hypothetical protein GCM10027299_23610 [Larkinella ripae]
MKKTQTTSDSDLTGLQKHFLIVLLTGLPVYLASNFYTKIFVEKDDEEAALLALIIFFGGIYSGRYLSQLWTSKRIPAWHFILLSLVGLSFTTWLFVHAEFPLNGRLFLNLLLFYIPLFIFCMVAGILIKLSQVAVKNQLQEAKAMAAQSQSELYLLQSQLSPHFLFNTLNNLYGLSLTQPDKIPTLLLKLSDLLRYSVYDTKELFVPLQDELAYLNNYIDFEKIRIGERLNLVTTLEETAHSNIAIAPMLLIVFIENAFKHAKNSADQTISIDISLKTWGNSLLFSVKNTKAENRGDNRPEPGKNRGLGLANVRKRLDLLYPKAHELVLDSQDGFFTVMLQLKVK